ncbi:MAG: hypothetical protein KAY65_12875 [Planctomycetes bacterium]|nr:hypothetical protein [Planctomycetota bacterium]
MCVLDLDRQASEKNDGLYTVADIRKLYEYGGGPADERCDRGAAADMYDRMSGRLRTCSHIIAALHISPVIDKAGQIDADLIIRVIEELDLSVKVRLPLRTKETVEEPEEQAATKAG